jgi:hypothetical protein
VSILASTLVDDDDDDDDDDDGVGGCSRTGVDPNMMRSPSSSVRDFDVSETFWKGERLFNMDNPS